MPFRQTMAAAVLAACLFLTACAADLDRPTPIAKVLTFADTSSVRIEVEFSDEADPGALRYHASIRGHEEGDELWAGPLEVDATTDEDGPRAVARVEELAPRLWSPSAPHLYTLELEATDAEGTVVARERARFGFRSVTMEDGRILLNGEPIFLRGNAINPPNRTIPAHLEEDRAFIEDYVRYQKSIGVNIIRMHHHSQIWFDVCDELGMMVYQGRYGTPEGGSATEPPDRPMDEVIRYYKNDVFEPLVNHPSVVIYVLSNEQASEDIPYLSRGADEVEQFLTSVYNELVEWDDNRLYIGNAGYGLGRSGDIADIHRYWGWYYNSFLSFYTLRDPENYWRTDRVQPITLSENTGNYTGPDGRFNLVSRSKQPDSQLNWTGHAPDDEQAERALSYQAFVAKQAIEITRRVRSENPYVAGLMPFTILFHRWHEIEAFGDMGPKPAAEQFATSYQPVLLSWELWTRQVYAGSTLRPVAHVVNDAEDGRRLEDLTLRYAMVDEAGRTVREASRTLPDVAYYEAKPTALEIQVPTRLETGTYTLRGELLEGDSVVATNTVSFFATGTEYAGRMEGGAREVLLHSASRATARSLRALGVPFTQVSNLTGLDPERHLLVLGAESWAHVTGNASEALNAFVAGGGRVLALRPSPEHFDTSWLPAPIRLQTAPLDHELVYPGGRPFRNGMAINPERPDHPVFSGIDRDRLFLWSDFTAWDQTEPGFPEVYPVTQGFVLEDTDDLARAAVLANYDHGLQGMALVELFGGKGSVLVSGFNMVDRTGLDPVADRMFVNLVRYMADAEPHHAHPLITSAITWGDYASERGLVTGIHSGLLLNTVPIVPEGLQETYPLRIDENGFHYARFGGGWNSRPSIQYVARGRRPFGPYHFSTGGAARLPEDPRPMGEGTFWCRVPEGRTAMVTTVSNPVDEPLELVVELNGASQRETVPAGETVRVETPLRMSDATLSVTYRGDRRLVLLETDFQ